MHILIHLAVSHSSLRLSSFFFMVFSFLLQRLENLNDLSSRSLILFSICSNLLLKISSEFFYCDYYTSQLQHFCLVPPSYNFCLIVDNLYIVRQNYPGFLQFIVYDFLQLFEYTLDSYFIKSVFNKSSIWVFSKIISINFFTSCEWVILNCS